MFYLKRILCLIILVLIYQSSAYAFESCQKVDEYYQIHDPTRSVCRQGPYNGGWVCEVGPSGGDESTCQYPYTNTIYLDCSNGKVLNSGIGECVCPDVPPEQQSGSCIPPPPPNCDPFSSNNPPDCSPVSHCPEASLECTEQCNNSSSFVISFKCTEDGVGQILPNSLECICHQSGDCLTGQVKVYTAAGAQSCAPAPTSGGCPTGYTYGTFNDVVGCINTGSNPSAECPTGTMPVTINGTMMCQPTKTEERDTCPTGFTLVTVNGVKACNPPDSGTGGTGTGSGTGGTGTGSGTGGTGTGSGTGGTGTGSGTGETGTNEPPYSNVQIQNDMDQTALDAANSKLQTDINAAGTALNTAANQKMNELETKAADASSSVDALKAYLMPTLSTTGGCDWADITILGRTVTISFCPYMDAFATLGNILFFFANLQAMFIVLRWLRKG